MLPCFMRIPFYFADWFVSSCSGVVPVTWPIHCPFGQTLRKLNLACNGIRQVCAGKSWFRKNSVLVFVIFLVCCKFWPHFLTQMHWNTSNSCIALSRPSRFCSRIVVHSPFKCVRMCFQSAKVCKCIWHIFCTWLDVFSIFLHHILIFCWLNCPSAGKLFYSLVSTPGNIRFLICEHIQSFGPRIFRCIQLLQDILLCIIHWYQSLFWCSLTSIVALFSLYCIRNVDIAHCTLNMIFPLELFFHE